MGRGRRQRVGVGMAPAGALAVLALVAGCTSGGASTTPGAVGSCPGGRVPIVVTVDQWGDIVDRLAGACGDVTTIVSGTTGDPHDYEPTPADLAAFTGAELVVVNGLDYDPWADKAVGALGHRAGRRRRGRRGRAPRRRQPPPLVRARLRRAGRRGRRDRGARPRCALAPSSS